LLAELFQIWLLLRWVVKEPDRGENGAEGPQRSDATGTQRDLLGAARDRREQTGQDSAVDAGHKGHTEPNQPVITTQGKVAGIVVVTDVAATTPAPPNAFSMIVGSLYRQHGCHPFGLLSGGP
jgi:hypothetical protein